MGIANPEESLHPTHRSAPKFEVPQGSSDHSKIVELQDNLKEVNQSLTEATRDLSLVRSDVRAEKRKASHLSYEVLRLERIRNCRRWAEKNNVWRLGIVLSVPPTVGTVLFVATDLISHSLLWSAATAFLVASGLFVSLKSTYIGLTVEEAEKKRQEYKTLEQAALARLADLQVSERPIADRYSRIFNESECIRAELRQLEAILAQKIREQSQALEALHLRRRSEERRSALFEMNWRAMRSADFEKYLMLVFKELGYSVADTRVTGDQGVDLIVADGTLRLAVQVKGYHNSVGNSAVQEAFAGKAFYQCELCAVITNSRFTPSAIELAQRVGCLMIHEDNFQKFVMGEIQLFPTASS
jgi:HJR/Mrr/RecB family endonuclease